MTSTTSTASPRALVTNDDGIDAEGLRTLASVAVEAGLDVVVAAPHRESSGSSASLTALEKDGRLVVHERRLTGLNGVRALAVEANPGLIALTAARGAFGPPPDLVLSGVNHGRNTGHAVLHSGTVGAALTLSTHGCRALAVSLADGQAGHWNTAAEIARRALDWLLQTGEVVALNLNVPDLPLAELRGLRWARLAAFGAAQTNVTEVGEGYVQLQMADVQAEHEAGTDAAFLAAGFATVTALRAPCEATGVDLSALADDLGAGQRMHTSP